MPTNKKYQHLRDILRNMDSVVVAYSGGVDSTFLLKVASDCLCENVLAVTAVSETYTKKELEFAKEFCKKFNIKHKVINTYEIEDENFNKNPRERCYFCKKELFTKLKEIKNEIGFKFVVDATNSSDKKDFRPGRKAKKELGVRSPLDEAGITKEDIRYLSKKLKLSTWDKPQMACLASRLPYGEKITKERLSRIQKAEDFLREHLKLKGNIRVRDYGDLARIEVDSFQMPRLITKDGFINKFKQLGYRYITLDLEGYRTGSMNLVQ